MNKEPMEFYINVFIDNKRGWMNTEQSFDQIEDAYEGILDGQRESTYLYTIQIECMASEKLGMVSHGSTILHLEQDAHEWQRDSDIEARQNEDSFIYAGSAGRRL